MRSRILLVSFVWLCQQAPAVCAASEEGCTIGVASARATREGRPLLWKIRDNSDLPNNSASFDNSLPHMFIAVTNSGDADVWMGVNETGFAVVNATASDLPGGSDGFTNGQLMRYALGTCSDVEEFARLLDSTNVPGRRTQANFAAIDARGAAVMFETGGYTYARFDANDPRQAPDGWVVRTNFSLTGGGTIGIERYRRALNHIREFRAGDSLTCRTLLRYHARDFSDYNSNPLPVPFRYEWSSATPIGCVYSNISICRYKSVSAVVINGVRPGEPPELITMWTILGQPAAGIAVPYWPVGEIPRAARGNTSAPLYDAATGIRSLLFHQTSFPDYIDTYTLCDECGNGLWSWTIPAEDSIRNATEQLLTRWRRGMPRPEQVLAVEDICASYALSQLAAASERLRRRKAFLVANHFPISDRDGNVLENGSIIHLIRAGKDGVINPPNREEGSPQRGMPTGDDEMIGFAHSIGENTTTEGTFQFQAIAWRDVWPGSLAEGDLIYVRVFNSDKLPTATRYGNAQLFRVSFEDNLPYVPVIEGGRTSLPLHEASSALSSATEFRIYPNFPNPFNASTRIEFDLPVNRDRRFPVALQIFNSLGQLVRSLTVIPDGAGKHSVVWDGTNDRGMAQPSGVYFVRWNAAPATHTGGMILVK